MGLPARVPAPLRFPVALKASYKDSVMRVLGFGALGLWGFRAGGPLGSGRPYAGQVWE